MRRRVLEDLKLWKDRPGRKPLIVRGARQVGKTTLVRLFAEEVFDDLLELDFERNPKLADYFESNDPRRTLELLRLWRDRAIVPGKTLLFLDEVQATPQVLASLRYFYEELPELHIVAAGSLLDLALEEPSFSVPVGRIEYLHLGPMGFGEFLQAVGRSHLAEHLETVGPRDPFPALLHDELLQWIRRFLLVGGMPEAVKAFARSGSYQESEIVKHSILGTFYDDFGKYGPKVDSSRLRRVFERLPALVGRKLKYVQIDPDQRSKDLAAALHLLCLARVAYRIRRTAANGIPLGAEASERDFKPLFLDVGLMTTATGLSALDVESTGDVLMIHRGALSEQLVGQHLLYSGPSWQEPRIHYWAREKRNSSAEVDFVLSQGDRILPVEVKAGTTGTLKSLHLFLAEKHLDFALRLSSVPPSMLETTMPNPTGGEVRFRLLSMPLYLVEQARRWIRDDRRLE